MLTETGNHRTQVEVQIRDMNGQKSFGFQMPPVNFSRFAGQQIRGDRVAGKGIQDQHVKLLRGFVFQREPGISHNVFDLCLAICEEGKVPLRQTDHLGIDFIEPVRIARLSISGQSAHAQSPLESALGPALLAIFGLRLCGKCWFKNERIQNQRQQRSEA